MRAAKVAATLGLLAFTGATASAQGDGWRGNVRGPGGQVIRSEQQIVRPDGKVARFEQRTGRPGPVEHDHGHHDHGHGHHHGGRVFDPYGGGLPYGYGAPAYGYGWDGIGVAGPGYGFDWYHGPAVGGFAINPPVYAYPPYGVYPPYAPYGYGTMFGYGTASYPVAPPLDPALLQYQQENDWRALSAKAADLAVQNVGDPIGTGAVPIPSTRDAKLKSLRYQAQGDEAFRNQDFVRAAGFYRQAFSVAKDNGAAFFRLGYAQIATGQLGTALGYFKRGLVVEPALVVTGPTPDELYGPDNGLAWSTHLGRVTRWVAEDIRDSDRVFLLGLLLYYDGDARGTELLTKAWQLSGGTETAILPLLNPPKVEGVKVQGEGVAAGPPVDIPEIETPAVEAPGNEGSLPGAIEAPALGAGADEAVPVLPEIPEPPASDDSSPRPSGVEPLFPLPSERPADDAAAPPLPAPVDAATGTEPR